MFKVGFICPGLFLHSSWYYRGPEFVKETLHTHAHTLPPPPSSPPPPLSSIHSHTHTNTYTHLSPETLGSLSQPSADRGNGITVVAFYYCCPSKRAYIESNFPLKVANCSLKIDGRHYWEWLAGPWCMAVGGIERISCTEEDNRRKAWRILKDVFVQTACEISHPIRLRFTKMAAVFRLQV